MIEVLVDLVLDVQAQLGECPRWDGERQRLWWVDIDGGLVHETDPTTGWDISRAVGQKVGAVAPRRSGGAVLAVASGFALLDAASDEIEPLADVLKPDDVIMNDGACDSTGRFWAGTVAEDERTGRGAGSADGAADQPHRVDLQHERRRAALLVCLWVKACACPNWQ